MISITIQTGSFSVADEEAQLRHTSSDDGALVMFQGMVRGNDHGVPLSHLYLEHFPTVTENEINRIIQLAIKQWHIKNCRVIHRVGYLSINEPIVLIMVTASHRKEAFLATEFIMDYLKTEAPFWKKECFIDGSEHWVEAKSSDDLAKNRWSL